MRGKIGYHARSHLPGGSDPIAQSVYGYAVYIQGQPNTVTVPTGVDATPVVFGAEFVKRGVVGFSNTGFYLPVGLWHLSAQAHWGSPSIGYEKKAFLQGLTFSYVDGSNVMDMESFDTIPDNSTQYVNKISTLFRQNQPNPSFAPIMSLSVLQSSGGDVDLSSATLSCIKLREL